MKASKLSPYRNVADYNYWQLTGRLIFLAVFLIAYSYCFLLTLRSVLKLFTR
jgi:hypothetical protein